MPGPRSVSMLSGGSGTRGPYQRPAVGMAAGRPVRTAAIGSVSLTIPNGRRPGGGGGGGGAVLTSGSTTRRAAGIASHGG